MAWEGSFQGPKERSLCWPKCIKFFFYFKMIWFCWISGSQSNDTKRQFLLERLLDAVKQVRNLKIQHTCSGLLRVVTVSRDCLCFLFNKEKEKEEKEIKKKHGFHIVQLRFCLLANNCSIYLKFLFWTSYICNRSILNIRNTIEYIVGMYVLVILIWLN